MGRIVINRTENDQTVILNDTPEGVSGGYFDRDMVWNELGGGEEKPLYSLIDGEFTFTSSHWIDFVISVSDSKRVTFENRSETPYSAYSIFNDVYNNTPSANAANVRDRSNSAVFPQIKIGDEIKLVVSNVEKTYFNDSGDKYISVALRRSSTDYASTGNFTEAEKTVDWTADVNVVICNIFLYTPTNIKSVSFDFELYVNGKRYC